MTKQTGNFSGPERKFYSETLCTWLIKSRANQKIELILELNNMHSGSSLSDACTFAYVEVYDGDSPSKTSFGRFCKFLHWPWIKAITSTGSSLYVTLWIDSRFQANVVPSFFATYRSWPMYVKQEYPEYEPVSTKEFENYPITVNQASES